jgi:hypothetical protein
MSVQAANKNVDIGFVEIKSKFDAEFRRFSVDGTKFSTFELFRHLLGDVHLLKTSSNEKESKFHVFYIDPKDDDLVYKNFIFLPFLHLLYIDTSTKRFFVLLSKFSHLFESFI